MLQDVQAGRSLEVEALLGSVIQVGQKVGVPTPRIQALYACAKLLDQTLIRSGAGIGPLTEGPRY